VSEIVVLRVIHIVAGVFWAGSVFFLVSFLAPTFKAVGPDAGKVFAELRRRRMFTWIPVFAVLTILVGLRLYMIRMGGSGQWMHSHEGATLGIGAISAIIALTIGIFGMRGPTLRAAALATEAGPMPDGPEKGAKMAQVMALRARATLSGRITATLLLITVVTMAIARYL
jgi:hypothetical protein